MSREIAALDVPRRTKKSENETPSTNSYLSIYTYVRTIVQDATEDSYVLQRNFDRLNDEIPSVSSWYVGKCYEHDIPRFNYRP